jgi:hypothetical protein
MPRNLTVRSLAYLTAGARGPWALGIRTVYCTYALGPWPPSSVSSVWSPPVRYSTERVGAVVGARDSVLQAGEERSRVGGRVTTNNLCVHASAENAQVPWRAQAEQGSTDNAIVVFCLVCF